MPAHLRPLPHCQWHRCKRPATQALHNAVNALNGVYCDKHAPQELAWLQKLYASNDTDAR